MRGRGGGRGAPPRAPGPPPQPPPIPLGPLGETMARGFDRLGWHWWPADTAIITAPFGDRPPCNNCGPCDVGCPTGSRSSADVTYWPLALRLGVELRTRCRVREITVDEQGRARGVLYYDESGSLQEQRAPLVIVAANGVGTPRLLLNSRSRAFPDGLANRAGMVGKCLMFHPFATASGILPDSIDSFKGPIGCSIFSHEFYETDTSRGFIRGFMMQVVRETGPLNEALGGATVTRIPWGRGHHAAFAERFGRVVN